MYSVICIRTKSLAINNRRIDQALVLDYRSKPLQKHFFIREFKNLSELASFLASTTHIICKVKLGISEIKILCNKVKSLNEGTDKELTYPRLDCYWNRHSKDIFDEELESICS